MESRGYSQSGHTLIVHLIIAKDGETVVTQGNANNVADAPIEIRSVKGAAFTLTELSFRKEKDEKKNWKPLRGSDGSGKNKKKGNEKRIWRNIFVKTKQK